MNSDASTTVLNTLTTTLIDSVNGYEDAASNSENSQFQQLFRERATERRQSVEELRAAVSAAGGEPQQTPRLSRSITCSRRIFLRRIFW